MLHSISVADEFESVSHNHTITHTSTNIVQRHDATMHTHSPSPQIENMNFHHVDSLEMKSIVFLAVCVCICTVQVATAGAILNN